MPPGIILLPACHPGDERPRLGPALFRPPQCPLKAVGMPAGQTGARHWEGGCWCCGGGRKGLLAQPWPPSQGHTAMALPCRTCQWAMWAGCTTVLNWPQRARPVTVPQSPPVLPVETENVRKKTPAPPSPAPAVSASGRTRAQGEAGLPDPSVTSTLGATTTA